MLEIKNPLLFTPPFLLLSFSREVEKGEAKKKKKKKKGKGKRANFEQDELCGGTSDEEERREGKTLSTSVSGGLFCVKTVSLEERGPLFT